MPDVTAIEQVDLRIAEAAAPVRRTRTVRLLGWLSEAADQPQLVSICAGFIVAGLLKRDPRLVRTGATMLASELLATEMKNVVKHRVDRTRPHVVDDGGAYRMELGSSQEDALTSFPSGHTAGAVTVARAFAHGYPELQGPAYGIAAAVAVVQVPRGKHYPTDLVAGAIIGVLAEAVAGIVVSKLAKYVFGSK